MSYLNNFLLTLIRNFPKNLFCTKILCPLVHDSVSWFCMYLSAWTTFSQLTSKHNQQTVITPHYLWVPPPPPPPPRLMTQSYYYLYVNYSKFKLANWWDRSPIRGLSSSVSGQGGPVMLQPEIICFGVWMWLHGQRSESVLSHCFRFAAKQPAPDLLLKLYPRLPGK